MWERRSYSEGVSRRCTVKFAGSIPPWPDATALGVEWDEPSRGRNDGDLNGVQYFRCLVPGAGSFIRSSRPYETEVSLSTAIYSKYVDNSKFEEIELNGGKSVETVGVEKVHKKYERVEGLSVMSLEASRIKGISGGPIDIRSLRALESLDLSNNLIESFDDVLHVVSMLPRLSCLRLNGNRILFNSVSVFPQVRELHVSNLLVTENDISIIAACFPQLRTLSLAQNRLNSVPTDLPATLTTLDLSCNFISELRGLPASLEALFISDNNLTELRSISSLPSTLDIRGHVLSWHDVSVLGSSGVTNLYITHRENEETEHRAFAIARCAGLWKLNGTIVTETERADAEMYTVSAVEKRKHPPLPDDAWQELTRKYGEPAPLPDRSIRARLISFYVDGSPNPLRIVRDAPYPRLLRQIARATETPLRDLSLARVRGCRQSYEHEPSRVLTVEEIIDDGSHLCVV